jgi:hypothetical protein
MAAGHQLDRHVRGDAPRPPEVLRHVIQVIAAIRGEEFARHLAGGFSSFIAFDRATKRGVVVLSDTSLLTVGGLGSVALHLLDASVPIGAPRLVTTADGKLIDALAGHYRLQSGLGLELRHKDKALTIQADGQPEFEMGYDSAGDFYTLAFDALLRPKRKANGTYTFIWFQSGVALEAERVGALPPVANAPALTEVELKAYEGTYSLAPTFSLKVVVAKGTLFVQGTNQGPIEVKPVGQQAGLGTTRGVRRSRGPRKQRGCDADGATRCWGGARMTAATPVSPSAR